jgi:multicomponent K+:H+ antiporter subunit F
MILQAALNFAFLAVAVAAGLCGWWLVRGRETVDRLLALDTLYVVFVALAVLLGMHLRTDLLLEAALIIALLGFVSTVALARYVSRGDVMD